MKKIFFLLLSTVLLGACCSEEDITPTPAPTPTTPVSSVSFDQTTTPSSVKVGESVTLTPIITPADATDKTITWSSSDTEVATVTDAGVVTALKAGIAIITATASNGKSAAWTITVAPAGPKLNIKVTSSDIATLKAIKVVTDQNIDGESKVKVLQVAEAQQKPAAEGTVYSIEIPSQEYGFYQIYLSEDGITYKEAMASKSNVGEITEDKAIDYEKNAVQLWADGPYFATENAGSMSWTAGMTAWGSAWTLPSETDLTTLINNNTPVYTQEGSTLGFKFTGTADGYTGNSIFLPSDGGIEDDGYADYWSSTEDGTGKVRFVSLNYSGGGFYSNWNSGDRTDCYFVRLVLR